MKFGKIESRDDIWELHIPQLEVIIIILVIILSLYLILHSF